MKRKLLSISTAGIVALHLAATAATASGAGACGAEIRGTDADDVLTGTPAADLILGLPGNDRLTGAGGSDCIEGGPGGDRLEGNDGDDRLAGGDTGDTIIGGEGGDTIRGEEGGDSLAGGAQNDAIDGGAGDDDVHEVGDGYRTGETIDVGANQIDSGAGRDTIAAANGRRDVILCGAGDDRVIVDRDDKLSGCERRSYLVSPFPQIDPSSGNRKRSFMVSFRSLSTTDRRTEFFSIGVKGPGRCSGIVSNSVGVTYHRNGVVRYRLSPFTGKGKPAKRWCRGRYHGSVKFESLEKAGCKVKADRKPPKCAAARSIGEFTFRVR